MYAVTYNALQLLIAALTRSSHEGLRRITSADMNTQDAYIYFFSNLKVGAAIC